MKRLIILLMTVIFFSVPRYVKAEEIYCKTANLSKLQKIASNITTAIDYTETFDNNNFGSINFKVTIMNLDKRIYLVNKETGEIYNITSNELVISNVKDNNTLHFQVYGNDYACSNKFLLTVYVNIPPYNPYYKSDICMNNVGNKLCNRWINQDLTYDELVKRLAKEEVKENVDENRNDESKYKLFIEIVYFLNKYKYYIFLPIIGISSLIIILKLAFKKKEWAEIK